MKNECIAMVAYCLLLLLKSLARLKKLSTELLLNEISNDVFLYILFKAH